MLGFVQTLATADLHISLRAAELFQVGPLKVTSSMLYGLISSVFIAWVMVYAARKITFRPKKGILTGAVESMVEYIINFLEGPFGSRETAARFTPIFGVYFVFIIFSNLLELMPWVTEGIYRNNGGIHEALFRPFTADLNGTIAMAVIAILMVQYLSIKEQGLKKHFQHYFTDKPLNPLNMFIGILEVFGELTRVMSLSLRLFLNTAVGDILITVFTSVIVAEGRTPFAVIPILAFEALVAFIQAYVFAMLAGTYLGLAIAHATHDGHPSTNIPDEVDTRGMIG